MAACILDIQIKHVREHASPMEMSEVARSLGSHYITTVRAAVKLTTLGYLEQRPGSRLYWPVVDADGNSVTGEKL